MFLFGAIALLSAESVPAATLTVPSHFATISSALAAASAGDTVLVSFGTYAERLTMKDGVVLTGAAAANPPVVDAQGLGVAITATNCGPATRVQDMIFRNGFSLGFGGGAQISGSSLTVERCGFESNTALHGGGVGGDGAGFFLIACTFDGNTATGTGGAVAITDLPSPTIAACRMTSNSAFSGGAIAVRNGCTPAITTTVLHHNTADQGSAVWWDFLAGGTLESCTIVENTALVLQGGALSFSPISSPSILGNIVAFNASGGALAILSGSSPVFGCNDVFGNNGGNSLSGGIDLGTNFELDPLFCNAGAGDFSLQSSSPCLFVEGCGQVGALGAGSCVTVTAGASLEAVTWGSLKARYR
jgi:predicted outer membrane repeat protein